MTAVRAISDAARRARLVRQHRLDGTAPDACTAVAATVAMHASDPVTPHLGVHARLSHDGATVGDADALTTALYGDRVLWRLHAVRRTLFVAAVPDAVVLEAAAGRAVAGAERRKLGGWLAAELGGRDPAPWLAAVEERVLEVLADGHPRSTAELTREVPQLATEVTLGSGRWTQRSPVSSRVLFVLAMEGRIVRAAPAGSWRSSQFRWAATATWFPTAPTRIEDPADGRAALARRYLATHGPATLVDVRWWTGWTAVQARAAVAAVGAVSVRLDGGLEGLVLAEEADAGADDAPIDAGVVAFLPGLDPTPMGWKRRDWFLGPADGPRARLLYDTNGNVGPTVWVDGRVVGGWAVGAGGQVVHRLLVDVGRDVADKVDRHAAALTSWLDGTPVTPRFRTPLERELTAGE